MNDYPPKSGNRQDSLKAPSEKHLEDWIIANPHLFGDLWPAEDVHPSHLANSNMTAYGEDEYIVPHFQHIITRQPRFPMGRPDLIVQTDSSVQVIELKKGPITADTIAQTLRYMGVLRELMSWVIMKRHAEIELPERPYQWEFDGFPEGEITGLIVGSGLADSNLPIVAAAGNIELFIYEYDQSKDFYTFTCERFNTERAHAEQYTEWAQGAIGDALIHTLKTNAERMRRLYPGAQS